MIIDGYLKIKYRLLLSAVWLCLIFCSHACIITDQAILHNPALQINTVPVHNFSFSEPEQGVRISLRPLKTLSQQSDEKEETRRNTGDEISAVNPESLSETDSGKTVVNPEIRFKPTPKLPSLPIEMQANPFQTDAQTSIIADRNAGGSQAETDEIFRCSAYGQFGRNAFACVH